MSEFIVIIEALVRDLLALFTDVGSRLNLLYLMSAGVIAFAIHIHTRGEERVSFLRFLAPPEVWRHPSHRTDIKLMMAGVLFKFLGLSSFYSLALLSALSVVESFGGFPQTTIQPSWAQLVGITLLFALVADFCTYWVHRLHHTNRFLWPFHKVHHSAEVMTPITMLRKHPLYDLFGLTVKGLATGLLQGLLLVTLDIQASLTLVGGANAVYVAFNLVGSNLRHTHIWLDYGPQIDRILISPAQHQIHHSRKPEHIDTNYGEVFALWDWLFGSLYVPQGREHFDIGLASWQGTHVEQPHRNLREALITPFIECYREVKKTLERERHTP